MEDFREFLERYKWRIIGVIFGLLVAILMFTIGFWRTLVLALIVGICFFIGRMLDNGSTESITSLFSRKNKD